MTHPNLIVEQRSAVATLTLNRPDKENTVDAAMMPAMIESLHLLGAGDGVRFLLLE